MKKEGVSYMNFASMKDTSSSYYVFDDGLMNFNLSVYFGFFFGGTFRQINGQDTVIDISTDFIFSTSSGRIRLCWNLE